MACVFCSGDGKLTKEHVIPKWLGPVLYRAQSPTGHSPAGKRFTTASARVLATTAHRVNGPTGSYTTTAYLTRVELIGAGAPPIQSPSTSGALSARGRPSSPEAPWRGSRRSSG
jgi:hypothetical protein